MHSTNWRPGKGEYRNSSNRVMVGRWAFPSTVFSCASACSTMLSLLPLLGGSRCVLTVGQQSSHDVPGHHDTHFGNHYYRGSNLKQAFPPFNKWKMPSLFHWCQLTEVTLLDWWLRKTESTVSVHSSLNFGNVLLKCITKTHLKTVIKLALKVLCVGPTYSTKSFIALFYNYIEENVIFIRTKSNFIQQKENLHLSPFVPYSPSLKFHSIFYVSEPK